MSAPTQTGHRKRAVVLLSGGLDSTTCLALARSEGYETYALTVEYGQKHKVELEAAVRVAAAFGAKEHRFARVDIGSFGGSALTTDGIAVPKPGDVANIGGGIPATYVPARNTVLLSIALAWAEVLCSEDLFIGITIFFGANARDYSGYPDCRPAFIEAYENMARLATKAGVMGAPVKIHAPLLHLSKAEIIQLGVGLGVDYGITHSCYDPTPEGLACGECDACVLRKKGFAEAGLADPTRYV